MVSSIHVGLLEQPDEFGATVAEPLKAPRRARYTTSTDVTRIAELVRWRQANAKPEEMVAEARKTADQAHLAARILIHDAFSGREYRAAAREMESWPLKDPPATE